VKEGNEGEEKSANRSRKRSKVERRRSFGVRLREGGRRNPAQYRKKKGTTRAINTSELLRAGGGGSDLPSLTEKKGKRLSFLEKEREKTKESTRINF